MYSVNHFNNSYKGGTMTKAELVAKISQDTGFTRADSEKALASVLGGIESALQKGDSVTLIGFGSFSVGERAARKGRNPKTGEEIDIPAKKTVKFKAGKSLSSSI
ncbi:MAG: HU family DNA-binding protein [Nitrospinota bacterium]